MDSKSYRNCRVLIIGTLCIMTGCIAPQTPVPTVWQKLGIPQAGARLRDGLVNRRGNRPGLERKPPVRAIADPANLEPTQPEMIKAAAEIKMDQDLKKQKIKAIKFLAEVNCGCYNKEGKVEEAFLAALEDCDPDVREAAIEALNETVGSCAKCNQCAITCCTKDIKKKLEDIATGMEDGCYKEPNPEIRAAAKALFCRCPAIPEDPIEPEELIAPKPIPEEIEDGVIEGDDPPEEVEGVIEGLPVSYSLSDSPRATATSSRTASYNLSDQSWTLESGHCISNPDKLIEMKTVSYRKVLGELLLQMPDAYELKAEWKVIVVDPSGSHSLATIAEVGGRRILLTLANPQALNIENASLVKLGLVSK
ncbi:MAG: hypothetical protein NXI32_27355 [bacterium]|nr:hypothetical protein [bacterium]